jgi:GntR family transcriptional regulator
VGATVVLLQRARCADAKPIALEVTNLVGGTSQAVMAADLRVDSLHAVLAGAGWSLRRGRATVTSEVATATDARHLEVARGEPMLVERRVIVDAAGRPVEATESRYVAGRYAIEVRFEVEGASDDRSAALSQPEGR